MTDTGATQFDRIRLQVMWDRLVSVVEEQARTLVRTAFSPSVREAGDLSAGVFDRQGRMLAQAVTGTPGHINAMAMSVTHFLAKIPLDAMRDGDHYITNNPWQTCGHLHDLTVVTPVFRAGRLVALFACTAHVVDIGGRGFGPDAASVFEEGLHIPIMRVMDRGQPNDTLLEMVRANVREPLMVEGDIFSLVACNDVGQRRLLAMMAEYDLADIDTLASHIIEATRLAMLRAIASLPKGTFRNRMDVDGYDAPVTLNATVRIDDGSIHVDFTGSSPASDRGINLVLNYTTAYTAFGVKCAVAPEVPNNAGSLDLITVSAPEDSLLNVRPPRPVAARHVIGQLLPDVVLGALYEPLPAGVLAEGSASLWAVQLRGLPTGTYDSAGRNSAAFEILTFTSGGMGARPMKDGLSATSFPSGVRGVSTEIIETVVPLVVRRKELRPDSGGAGEHRGGMGQTIEIESAVGEPFAVLAMFDRVNHPARGRAGGQPGAPGTVALASGQALRNKGLQVIPAGDRLVLNLPGGGGFGDPARRAPERVQADLRAGLVSAEAARRDHPAE